MGGGGDTYKIIINLHEQMLHPPYVQDGGMKTVLK